MPKDEHCERLATVDIDKKIARDDEEIEQSKRNSLTSAKIIVEVA